MFRYGIGDRLELRFGYNYEMGRASSVAEGDIAGNFGINAEQQILYGFKYAVTRQNPECRFMPNSAFLAQAHTPIGSIEGQTQMRLGYAWGWALPNGWTLDQGVRFGTDREGHDNYTLWAPSTVLRIPLGREKRWFTHVEYFGIMSQGKEHGLLQAIHRHGSTLFHHAEFRGRNRRRVRDQRADSGRSRKRWIRLPLLTTGPFTVVELLPSPRCSTRA